MPSVMHKYAMSALLWSLRVLPLKALEHLRDPTELCCFNLETRTTESNTPGFILELFPILHPATVRYCLDTETGRLTDSAERSRPLFSTGFWTDVETQDFAYGRTDMHEGFGIGTTDGGDGYLLYDSSADFFLQQEQGYFTYRLHSGHGTDPVAGEGGIAVRLFLRDQSNHCEALRRRVLPEPRGAVRHASREPKSMAAATGISEASSKMTTTTLTCDMSASAPSLVPEGLFVRPENWTTYSQTANFTADIDTKFSTVFQFTLTDPFHTPISNWSGMCGLQFRLPVCTQLPREYPCYQFSGMEQEAIQKSGMRFSLIEGSAHPSTWRTLPLIQVWPGESTLVGTFECGEAAHGPGGVKMELSWLAESINGFALHFLQAGAREYRDGVGLFVVACL